MPLVIASYYNDNDPFCAQWLQNLIDKGHLPHGRVDCRSIADIDPDAIKDYTQAHFFAGIGGWPYALRLAGWPSDRPVWTGSCPCQPLSSAGKRQGHTDERHLWPAFFDLIAEYRPATIFGEQVDGALGLEWVSGVSADLEAIGYAVGVVSLPAAGVGAPHIRQRLFWVADDSSRLGHADADRCRAPRPGLDRSDAEREPLRDGRLGDAEGEQVGRAGQSWQDGVWLPCLDGKARRAQPGIFPLVDGLPRAVDGLGPISRVGTLRGAGNAIVPQVAAVFIQAFLECGKG